MASLNATRRALVCALLAVAVPAPVPAAAAVGEEHIKAVFLFNFSHFVEWPQGQSGGSAKPFVVSVAGASELLPLIEEVVRGESVDGRPLRVAPLAEEPEADVGQIVFIGHSQARQLPGLLDKVARTGTLTVSDIPDAARRGVMIELVKDRNRIRLRINLEAARAAGLTISSNLLRAAEIIATEGR